MARKVNQVLWGQWRQRLEGQRESGLSIAAFCRTEGGFAGRFPHLETKGASPRCRSTYVAGGRRGAAFPEAAGCGFTTPQAGELAARRRGSEACAGLRPTACARGAIQSVDRVDLDRRHFGSHSPGKPCGAENAAAGVARGRCRWDFRRGASCLAFRLPSAFSSTRCRRT